MSPAAAPPPVLVEREPAAVATRLVCAGCGAEPPAADPFAAACPARRPGDDVDHVIARRLDLGALRWPDDPDPNPFVRYRTLFHAWHVARAAGWPDARYVGLVRALDDAVAAVDGHGFRVTPLVRHAALAERLAIAPPGGVAVKDETGNVAGSHKARHLFGILLELRVAEAVARADPSRPLAIASCGNAALAAAVVARAANRELRVFVPVDADPGILDRLASLGARVTTCPRRPGEPGDPTVARLREALAAGAIPFTCQGPDNGLAIEGGATLGWEIADELRRDPHGPPLDRVVVQVGGGALASGVALGLCEARTLGAIHALPRLDTVQTRGGFPLARAFERATVDLGLTEGVPAEPEALAARMPELAHHRSRYMWPWEVEPRSVAHGILDDETYDWLAVVRAMLATGGRTVVVDEGTLLEASALGLDTTGIAADETGTAGLAGLLALARERAIGSTESVAVIFSGVRRTDAATIPPTQPDRSSTS